MNVDRKSRAKLTTWGICLVALSFSTWAQESEIIPKQLNVVVVQGEGAVNQAHQRVTPEPKIRVEDENHHPVAGASVVFTLPTEGATGEFGNGSKTLVLTTDRAGEAAAQGLRTNNMPGKTPIHVAVSYKGLTVRTIISQETVLAPGAKAASPKHGHGALIAILVVIGGAAAGGAVYGATHGGSSTQAAQIPAGPSPIGITPGTGAIAGGH